MDNWLDLIAELDKRFPLREQLAFSTADASVFEVLPPAISVFTAATEPEIPGDCCLVFPKADNFAFCASILAALSSAKVRVPKLLSQYVSEGFAVGDRVRVLPSGHVYIFDGHFGDQYGNFFRLRFLDDSSNASRSFTIREAVRLEKTTRTLPKGRGDSSWGKFQVSELDILIGTETGGNNALLRNEIIIVGQQAEFADFLENTWVRRTDHSEYTFLLRDVIPWGVIDETGQMHFKSGGAATGEPLIAVASRLEYAAAVCRKQNTVLPRVIVDGAFRTKNLQAFDTVTELSKLLVVAEHSERNLLTEVHSRGCEVWCLPPETLPLLGEAKNPLWGKPVRSMRRASQFKFETISCSSDIFDKAAEALVKASQILETGDHDDGVLRCIGAAYTVLIEMSSILGVVEESDLADLQSWIHKEILYLENRRNWMPQDAYANLYSVLNLFQDTTKSSTFGVATEKLDRLMSFIAENLHGGKQLAVLTPSHRAARSVIKLLKNHPTVTVSQISKLSETESYYHILLTGWPKASALEQLMNRYMTKSLSGLAYEFERVWFKSFVRKRDFSLARWRDPKGVGDVTRLSLAHNLSSVEVKIEPKPDSTDALKWIEQRLAKIRKGNEGVVFTSADARVAKFVSFVGMGYGYLTESHSVPKVSALLAGIKGQGAVSNATIADLSVGDFVLFRYAADSDKDIIRYVADTSQAEGEYDKIRFIAEQWKEWLRSIGSTPFVIRTKLSANGVDRTEQAIRGWLGDPARIGPGEESTLKSIASLSKNNPAQDVVQRVWSAIQTIRGTHMAAGMRLTKLLINALPGKVTHLNVEETIVELDDGEIPLGKVAILQIESIAENFEERPYWEVNRLLFAERD